jgi:hypothetical protein
MPSRKNSQLVPLVVALALAACSGGGGGGSGGSAFTILSVTQDLDLDPEGFTTVIAFAGDVEGAVDASMFSGSGGESPLSFGAAGSSVTIVWDGRLTPGDVLNFDDLAGHAASFAAIHATDESPPTFAASGTQVAGLGGDGLTIVFAGAHVIAAEVEDAARWALYVEDQALDLAGSVFAFDPATQTASVALGAAANLHAAFELAALDLHSVADVALDTERVAGAASGDATAPAFLAATQNLAEDAFGRAIDFTFDEDVDPLFALDAGLYVVGFPILPVTLSIPTSDTVRVTYSVPVIPGFHAIDVGAVPDCAGNTSAPASAAVAAGSTVANAVESIEATTVANAGGDTLEVVFAQAFETASAEDFVHWTLESPAGTILDLSGATFDYDWTTRTLALAIEQDLRNGDTFTLTSSGVLEIDGESTAGLSAGGTVAGETIPPAIESAVQNRLLDPSGATVDVSFGEDLDEASAEAAGGWATDGAHALVSATLQGNQRTVRLVFDSTVLPGEHQLLAGGVEDLAGNVMAPTAMPVVSNDLVAPSYGGAVAEAPEAAGDTLELSFTDDMWPADVEDVFSWSLESPVGAPLDLSSASVDYDAATRVARLTLDDALGPWLQARDSFEVSLSGMRDLGANVVAGGALAGVVDAEWNYPRVISVRAIAPGGPAAGAAQLGVRFSEAMQDLDDLASGVVEYVYRDASSAVVGAAAAVAVDSDRHGAVLSFPFAVDETGSLDVRGVADLAGNVLFTELGVPVDAEDSSEPGIDGGATAGTTAAGDDNDTLAVTFDRNMDPSVADLGNFVLEDGAYATIDLGSASIAFDGAATVTIGELPDGFGSGVYNSIFNLKVLACTTSQGVALSAEINHSVAFSGDLTPPAVASARVDPADPDALLLIFDEPVLSLAAGGSASINGSAASSIEELDARVYRLGFVPGVVSIGATLDVTVEDRAANVGVFSQAIAAADAAGPSVSGASAIAVEGFGGDLVHVSFDEPVDQASALDWRHYQMSDAAGPIDLSLATFSYRSLDQRVTIELPAGRDLDASAGAQLALSVDGVDDVAGNPMPVPADLLEAIGGDLGAVSGFEAFVNYRHDAAGTTVDLVFSEEVDEAFAVDVSNWWTDGGAAVVGAQMLRPDIARLSLSTALGTSDRVILAAGLADAASHVTAGALSGDPTE